MHERFVRYALSIDMIQMRTTASTEAEEMKLLQGIEPCGFIK
jgi:hypothetical protein